MYSLCFDCDRLYFSPLIESIFTTKPAAMVEVFNLEGMPVYKLRSEEKENFTISDLEGKGLPCGIYFVKIKKAHGTETAKLLIC